MTKLLEVSKMTSLKFYISPSIKKLETLKFGQEVNLIQKVSLGTLPQEVVTSLPHKYLVTEGLLLSNVGGKSNFLTEVHRIVTSPLWVVTSLPDHDHVTLVDLYISSYRETTGATFIHANV